MALPATDVFTGANGDPLSANWTIAIGTWRIWSNSANGTASAFPNLAWWNADSFADDQYSQATFSTFGGSAWGGGVAVRVASERGYFCYLNSANNAVFVNRVDSASSQTQLAELTGFTYVDGDTLRLEISGTTLSVKHNGSLVGTVNDGTYASGSAGISSFNANEPLIDNWEGGNLSAPAGDAPVGSMLM